MSSPPSNMRLEGLIADCFDESALTPIVIAALEPYRESIEQIADDYREDEASWRDYRRAVWSPVPEDVLSCIDRIVETQAKLLPAAAARQSAVEPQWFPVPGSTGVRARALVPPGGKVGVYLLEFEDGGGVPWHCHTNDETIFVVSGEGSFYSKYGLDAVMSGGICAGFSIRVPGNQQHRLVGENRLVVLSVARPDWGAT